MSSMINEDKENGIKFLEGRKRRGERVGILQAG